MLCATLQVNLSVNKNTAATVSNSVTFFLQSLIRKLDEFDIGQISDSIMQTLLMMLSATSGQVGGVQEDALLTIGVLVEGM